MSLDGYNSIKELLISLRKPQHNLIIFMIQLKKIKFRPALFCWGEVYNLPLK